MLASSFRQECFDPLAVPRAALNSMVARQVGVAAGFEFATAIPGLVFYRHFAPTVMDALFEPSISLVVSGRKRVEMGGEAFVYDETRFLVTAVDVPVMAQILEASEAEPYLSLMLKLDLDVAREFLAARVLPDAGELSLGSGMTTGPVTADLLNPLVRLVALLQQPQHIPFIAGIIQREIVYRVLTGELGARLAQIALADTQSNRVARAIAWLKQNYARPLRVEELAESAHMGVSTLHHHFRAVTAMSPLQYQKRLRLYEARRLMLSDSMDANSAALQVGYDSPQQFSREYRRLFGQPPLRDIKALRRSTLAG